MDAITLIAEVLQYTLPAVLVLLGIWLVQDSYRKKELRKERLEIRAQALSKIMPLRLQAYERAVLFLERISPENLLLRAEGKEQSSRVFQTILVAEIRAEYEHNIAQQLYISQDSWFELLKAKDRVIGLIQQSAIAMQGKGTGTDLSRVILAKMTEENYSPCRSAIESLKSDIQRTFKLVGA